MSTIEEKISKANEMIKTLERKDTFAEPETFGYEQAKEAFPYEGGPIIVHGKTIPEAWIRMINCINRFGRKHIKVLIRGFH